MKRKILVLLVLFIITLMITGCGGEESNSIIGTWKSEKDSNMVYTFNEDGTGKLTGEEVDISFKYVATDDGQLTFTTEGASITEKYKIENNKLIINDSYGNEEIYVRK